MMTQKKIKFFNLTEIESLLLDQSGSTKPNGNPQVPKISKAGLQKTQGKKLTNFSDSFENYKELLLLVSVYKL